MNLVLAVALRNRVFEGDLTPPPDSGAEIIEQLRRRKRIPQAEHDAAILDVQAGAA